jgi:putative exosortase-associated protein (TIGR04073 family)
MAVARRRAGLIIGRMRTATWRTGGRAVVFGLALAALAAPAAAAEEEPAAICPICSKANDTEAAYHEQAGSRFTRGLLNFTLGWTEMIRQPAIEAKEGHHVATGIGKGLNRSAARTAQGLGEALTFWMVRKHPIHRYDCPLDMHK